MKVSYNELFPVDRIVIWGAGKMCGNYYKRLDPRLNIIAFCDSDRSKWCDDLTDGIPCISKDQVTDREAVLIAVGSSESVGQISRELDDRGIKYCHILEAVKAYLLETDKIRAAQCEQRQGDFPSDKIVKFINCHVPYKNCNLSCGYCYIRQHRDFKDDILMLHSPQFIRKALSKNRLGGTAFINFCGEGETLLCRELIPIVKELIEEGHYIQLVTNGTVTKAFDELLELKEGLAHVFIKFSFHYQEMKRLKLLERFVANVHRMRAAGASVSLELVPEDEAAGLIQEIKDFSMEHFQALPHCTVPRDDTADSLKILTQKTVEEFEQIWGQFHSVMFDFKMKTLGQKRFENCQAGLWSFQMDLETGDIRQCIGNPYLDNIYEDLNREIYLKAVGKNCCLPYCYNCHAYLALGLVEEIEAPSYYEVRDRETLDGSHWITDNMKKIFLQKLYFNHRPEEEA